jgi:TetR/AcrR family fatty acid metabolism transcriptional regulator
MSPRPDVSAQRMPQILAAAGRVFGEKGLAGATVADVAEAAGFSKALVFKYFHSKDELVVALLAHLFVGFPAPEQGEGQSCRDALMVWAEAAGRSVAESGLMASVGLELMAQASRNMEMRAIVQGAYADLARRLEAVIVRGVAAGEFAACDARQVAQVIIAQMEGANLLHLVRLDGFSVETAYRDGLSLALAGIRP